MWRASEIHDSRSLQAVSSLRRLYADLKWMLAPGVCVSEKVPSGSSGPLLQKALVPPPTQCIYAQSFKNILAGSRTLHISVTADLLNTFHCAAWY